jgi:hypothetical protein
MTVPTNSRQSDLATCPMVVWQPMTPYPQPRLSQPVCLAVVVVALQKPADFYIRIIKSKNNILNYEQRFN